MAEDTPTPDPKQGPLEKLRLSTIKKRIVEYRGNVARIAKSFGRDRQTIYNYLKRYDAVLRPILEAAQEIRLDHAEGSLDDAIDRGEGWAVALLLHTKGRKRGYGKEVGITGGTDEVTNERLPIQITLPDNGRETKPKAGGSADTQDRPDDGGRNGDRTATGPTDENPLDTG
jgi:hypothetical protein